MSIMANREDSNYFENQEYMFCEFCYKDGKESQLAEGFCVECVTYFCTTCLKYHEKFHPHHIQQDKDSMPQDFYTQMCTQHPDELVKFYCLTCNNTACSICKLISHKQCQEIHHLPKLAKNFYKIKEFLYIKDAIVEAEKQVAELQLMVENGQEKVRKNNIEVKAAINQDRKEINKTCDNLESQVDEAEAMDNEELEEVKGKILTITTKISTLKSDVENTVSDRQKSKVFVAVKSAKVDSQSILGNLQNLKASLEEKEISKFEYAPFETILDNTSTGNSRLTSTREKVKNERVLFWSLVLLVLSFVVDIYQFEEPIKSQELKLNFEPLTLSYMSTNTLLTGAFDSKTIYTVDKTNDKHEEIHLGKFGYTSAAKIKDEIAILFTDGYIVLYMNNEPSFNFNRRNNNYIRVRNNGQHFVYNNGTFFILYGGAESRIKLYDITGNLLKDIEIWDKFQILSPWNIAVSPYNDIIYITDSDLVVMLTTDGEIKGYFRHTDLIRPTGMTTDSDGNLYVCGYLSNNVFKIAPDFSEGYELFGKRHGINRPFSISYNEDENELAVGCFRGKSIQIFKLNQTWFQYIKPFFRGIQFWFTILKMFLQILSD